MMFEYALIERARADRRRVVLPEGTEERILRAAEIVLRRGVCDLTLLGPEEEIARRAREFGLDIDGAHVVDPAAAPVAGGVRRRVRPAARAQGDDPGGGA